MKRPVFQVDLVGIPLLGVAILWTLIGPIAFLVAPGAFAWIIAEYGIHRWVFHRVSPGHIAHHRDQIALIGASPLVSLGVGSILLILAAVVAVAGPAVLGFLGAYFWYFVLHSGLNHGVLVAGRIAAHRQHHDVWRHNFGVTTSLLDRLLRTYSPPGKG